MNIEQVEELNYHSCLKLSILYGLIQTVDFYFAFAYHSSSTIVMFDITTSFWFLVNGFIGIQYSLLLIMYQLSINTYRSHLILRFPYYSPSH